MAQSVDEQAVVVSQVSPSSYPLLVFLFILLQRLIRVLNCSQVLVADINIGYEDIVNTQVRRYVLCVFLLQSNFWFILVPLINIVVLFLLGSCFQW